MGSSACTAELAKLAHAKALDLLPIFKEDDDCLVRVAAQRTYIANVAAEVPPITASPMSIVTYASWKIARDFHHGLGAAAVPMLQAVETNGVYEAPRYLAIS